jgi:hypothetical protein
VRGVLFGSCFAPDALCEVDGALDVLADVDGVVDRPGDPLGVLLVLPGGGQSGFNWCRSRSTIASASPLLFAVIPDST